MTMIRFSNLGRRHQQTKGRMWVRRARAPKRRLLQRKGKDLAPLTVKVNKRDKCRGQGVKFCVRTFAQGFELCGILSLMGVSSSVKLDYCGRDRRVICTVFVVCLL